MLVAPHQFAFASHPVLRTNPAPLGGAFLAVGAGQLAAAALVPTGLWRIAAHLAAGAVLLLVAQGFVMTGGVAGAIAYGVLGAATAAVPFVRRQAAPGSRAP